MATKPYELVLHSTNNRQTHHVSKGDTLSPLGVELVKPDGTAVDLRSRTVTFVMVDEDNTTVVDGGSCTVTDAENGRVQYDFQAADVATAGTFFGWFRVTVDNQRDTFPPDGRKLKIEVHDQDDY